MTSQTRIDKGMYWQRALTLVEGCTAVSDGCDHCWAAQASHMRSFQKGEKIHTRHEGLTRSTPRVPMQPILEWGEIPPEVEYYFAPAFNGIVRPQWDALDLPLHVKKPTTFAVWNDLFHEDVPKAFIGEALRVMDLCKEHRFLLLTKRARRMGLYVQWYGMRNVWLGVTAENQKMACLRLPYLERCDTDNRWVSVEPMLSAVDLQEWLPHLGWVVCGPETGKHKRPCNPAWIEDLYEQCKAAGVPFFDKRKVGWLAREMPEGV